VQGDVLRAKKKELIKEEVHGLPEEVFLGIK
jgi:hypothetical protein